MALKHQLLALAYYPLKLRRAVLGLLGKQPKPRLRVLIYHDIAPEDENRFATQLHWLSRSWCFIAPEDFVSIVSGRRALEKDSLLLTFDDGFASNRQVVEHLLNPMGIRALFFVVSGFVPLQAKEEASAFIARYIYPGKQINEIPQHLRNMGWGDLEFLLESGHTIGAHTAHHCRLSKVPEADLDAEIIVSADHLEQRLGIRIEHFAYPFGNLASFNQEALTVATSRFPCIYTGMRGDNNKSIASPWAIRRDAIGVEDSLLLIGSLLEGGADWAYRENMEVYESWLKK